MNEQNKKDALWDACKKWIEERDITSADSIYQCDRVMIDAPELVELVCDHVGYVVLREEDCDL